MRESSRLKSTPAFFCLPTRTPSRSSTRARGLRTDRTPASIGTRRRIARWMLRGGGPPWEATTGLSAYYLAINRNKESIALDLATEAGAESVRVLARHADVLVENFLPGGLEKLGLPLGEFRRENPRLVTASITGSGRIGDEAALPGFDLLAQAAAGLMAVTGSEESGPTKVGVAVSDLFAGCFALAGILALLAECGTTGRGG